MKASFTVSCWHYDIHWREATHTLPAASPRLTHRAHSVGHARPLSACPACISSAPPCTSHFHNAELGFVPQVISCHFPLCLEYFWGFLVKLYLFSYAQV